MQCYMYVMFVENLQCVDMFPSFDSFEPSAVYCFLTVFNPFVMGGLLMLKVRIKRRTDYMFAETCEWILNIDTLLI